MVTQARDKTNHEVNIKINSKELCHSEKYNVWIKDSSRTVWDFMVTELCPNLQIIFVFTSSVFATQDERDAPVSHVCLSKTT